MGTSAGEGEFGVEHLIFRVLHADGGVPDPVHHAVGLPQSVQQLPGKRLLPSAGHVRTTRLALLVPTQCLEAIESGIRFGIDLQSIWDRFRRRQRFEGMRNFESK